ncbi:excinuclease [Acinetobacter rathckeae]|uniref:excinuclease n=1 Tax=Acinetobacter rathckeae TaxID=2605272 RepID=UPI0018A28348|nr:excinuclease [Acinetobacter rathckeae]MBF7687792.1 excinuclease [Acinetobacter rathckeae]MBF7687985.1 excinuclease [Acinetobacter rathckeae]MBF7695961.1 excinuclease [Acinetobacter rathckeae]
MIKKVLLSICMLAGVTTVQAADKIHQLNFNDAVQKAVSDGTLDGTVKFYLADTKSGGKVLQKDIITNKKTNGFAKSAEESCDWVLRSALIQLQDVAKQRGGNAVTNIVSYYKSHEVKSTTTYDCHKGMAVAGVALKGDIVKY